MNTIKLLSYSNATHYFKKLIYTVFILLLTHLSLSIAGEDKSSQLVSELLTGIRNNDFALIAQMGSELKNQGTNSIPAIHMAFAGCSDDETVYLVRIITGIGGNESTQLLVELFDQNSKPYSRRQALHAIGNRPISFQLTTNQVGFLEHEICKGDVLSAATAAQVLSRCEHNEKKNMIKPILDRFIHEASSSSEIPVVHGSYLSPRVYVLNQFILAFKNLGEVAVVDIQSALSKADLEETQKWLILALGICGDSASAPDIKRLIEEETDVYFRSVAVRAYTRSAKEQAIPFLKTLLKDDAISGYDRLPNGIPIYPVRLSAREELAKLNAL